MDVSDLPPLSHAAGEWDFTPVLTALLVVVAAGYLVGLRRLARTDREHYSLPHAAAFLGGLLVIGVTAQGPIEVYWDALYWVHMVGHLLLIMVAPVLLVLGRPLTVAWYAPRGRARALTRRLIRSGPVSVLTHPAVGLGCYAVVIVGTHLTGFLDQVVVHPWLHWVEISLYLVGGVLFFLPLVGSEPIRWRLSFPAQGLILFLSMPIDTGAGVTLMLYNRQLLPVYMAHRPAWALNGITDLHTGGAVMWVAGDGLMMVIVTCLFGLWALRSTQDTGAGPWIESIRASTLRSRSGYEASSEEGTEKAGALVDDDERAHDAYNAYLTRLGEADRRHD